ncbi:MAG TPA: sugar phosphate nucleotidyltransferase [Gemmatimonadales bacterium]|nr:sugar phosphate nucleotidyltransferase [Gemmatimonadales bacterium]
MNWAVILAGGAGTRFWPLSTPARPKQLLPLAGSTSLAEETFARLSFIPPSQTLVVTGADIAPALITQLRLDPANVLVEPRAASTGPALVWATSEALRRDPSASVLALHADWSIGDTGAFAAAAKAALSAARNHDRLITVGIVPSRPETGYGYIVPGERLDLSVHTVERFTEKPDAKTALDLMAEGALWNSGLFAWTGARLLAEIREHTPEIAPHLARLAEGDVPGFFRAVTPVSIDVGLLERSRAIAVLPGHFDWDDIGTWEALTRVRSRDEGGNIGVGPVTFFESGDCVAWSDGMPVVVGGLHDVIAVVANGRVLVIERSRAADLKRILDSLPPEIRNLPA